MQAQCDIDHPQYNKMNTKTTTTTCHIVSLSIQHKQDEHNNNINNFFSSFFILPMQAQCEATDHDTTRRTHQHQQQHLLLCLSHSDTSTT